MFFGVPFVVEPSTGFFQSAQDLFCSPVDARSPSSALSHPFLVGRVPLLKWTTKRSWYQVIPTSQIWRSLDRFEATEKIGCPKRGSPRRSAKAFAALTKSLEEESGVPLGMAWKTRGLEAVAVRRLVSWARLVWTRVFSFCRLTGGQIFDRPPCSEGFLFEGVAHSFSQKVAKRPPWFGLSTGLARVLFTCREAFGPLLMLRIF